MVWIKVNVIPRLLFLFFFLTDTQNPTFVLLLSFLLTQSVEKLKVGDLKEDLSLSIFLTCSDTSLSLDCIISVWNPLRDPWQFSPLQPLSSAIFPQNISKVDGLYSESIWTIMLYSLGNLDPTYWSLRNSIMQRPALCAIQGQQMVVFLTAWFISCFLPACELKNGFLLLLVHLLLISFISCTKEWFLLYVHMYYNTPTVRIHFPFWWFPCDYLIVHLSSVFIWCSKLTCDRKHVVLLCVCLIFSNMLTKSASIFRQMPWILLNG